MLEYKERPSSALPSEVSSEKKFVISKDNLLHDRFAQAVRKFALPLREAAALYARGDHLEAEQAKKKLSRQRP